MSRKILSNRNWRKPLSLLLVLSFLAGLVSPLMSSPVVAKPLAPQAEVVATYGFENSTQGWYGRGPAQIAPVTEMAYSGDYSLKVTGRTSGWNGPAVNISDTMKVGATYIISGCIRLTEGMTTTRTNFALEYRYPGVENPYPWIANVSSTTDGEWACMQGTFDYAIQAETLVLYAEAADANVSFYIDDVSIVMTTPPPVVVYDFETDNQGWYGRGTGVSVSVVSDTVHTGAQALQVTDRSDGWHGPAVNVGALLEVGNTYEITGCIRLAEGMTTTRANFALTYAIDGSASYPWLGGDSTTTDAEWSCMSGTFEYTTAVDDGAITLYAEAAITNTSFYIDDVIIYRLSQQPIQTDIPSVYETYANDFIIGAALETDGVQSTRHEQLLQIHFNSITAGNAMKPGPIHPISTTYNFSPTDTIANYARDNDMYLHGHTLVWHSQAAEWMFETDAGEPLTPTLANKELVLERMEEHIRTVVGRYGDVVNVWDVVNEVIDPGQPDCYRRSIWYELTGSEYITRAFQIAHEEAPTATLILNDYSETDIAKRECMYTVVKNLQDQGVPVGGIGMQMHIDIQNPPVPAIEAAIQRFAELGEVHITELDMSIYPNDIDSYTTVPESVLIRQGHRYKDIFAMLRKYGAAGTGDLKSVTFWGMADDATWLSTFPIPRLELPLLFDTNLQAKHAYWGLIDPSRLPVNIQEQISYMGSPVLDGTVDPLWTYVSWVEIPSNGAISATFQTRWDQDYLYVIADVVDATADAGDKVEVFVDQNDDNATSYQGDDRHYTYPSQTGQVDYVIITNTHGYRLEARLPLTVELAIGDSLGFDIRVTDGSNPGAPISWNDPTHSQDTNPSQFGTLIMADAMRVTTAIEGTPVIDAVADELWADAATITTDLWALGNNGATATVKTMWDSNHLYVFAVVSDSLLSKASANAYEQDSIEVFLDQNNGKTSSYESDDGQYRVNFDNERSFGGSTVTTTLTSAAVTTTWGYAVELAITLTDVVPQDGVVVGFDFQVNDDGDGAGARTSIAKWSDPTDSSWQSTSRFGVLEFVEESTPTRFMVYLPLVMRGVGATH